MRWFNDNDFMCKCKTNDGKSCGFDCSDKFKQKVDEARELAGVPFVITSGARCLEYNRSIGSKDTSSHVKGLAADIKYKDDLHLTRIVHALSRVGFTRIGVNKDKKFIHVDYDKDKVDAVFGY